MLQVAVDKQKILTNPCARVQPPRVPKREMAFLSWQEVAALANAHNDRLRTFIYFAVDTGMRWSELVGLRRGDVDLSARKVRVTSHLVRLESGKWLRKEPKTPASLRRLTSAPPAERGVYHGPRSHRPPLPWHRGRARRSQSEQADSHGSEKVTSAP